MGKREKNRPVAKRRKKPIILLLLIVLGLAVAAMALVPLAARYALTRWLIDNGADSAVVEKVTINPFTGQVSLQGVDVTRNGKVVLAHSTVSLDLGLRQLFSREVMIKRSELKNLVIDIERSADNVLRIGSYRLPESSGEPSVDQTVTTSAPWIFRAREVHLGNVVVRYTQPGLALDLRIDQATLERFSTDPADTSGELRLDGSLNGAPLSLLLNKLAITTGVTLSGQVELSEFPLDTFAELLAREIQPFTGTAGLAGDFNLSLTQSAELAVAYAGSLSLAADRIGAAGWQGSGGFSWQGVLSGSSKAGIIAVNADGVLTADDAAFAAGTTRISGGVELLQISGKTALSLGETIALETTADMTIDNLTAVLAEHSLAQKNASWKGQFTLDIDQEHTAVGAAGTLALDDLTAETTGLVLTQQSLLLDGETGFSLVGATGTTDATFQGDLQLAGSTVQSGTISFFSEGLAWQGDLGYTSPPEAEPPQVTLHGTLTATDSRLEQETVQRKVFLAGLELKTDASLHLGTTVEPFGTAHLQAGRLTAADGEAQWLSFDSLMVDSNRGEAADQLALNQILVENIHLPPSAYQAIDISLASLSAEDIVASTDFRSSTVGTLHLGKPTVIDPEKATILAEIDELTIIRSTIEDYDSLHIESLRSGKGAFFTPQRAGGQTPIITLGSLTLDDISWHPEQGAAVKAITFIDLNGNLVKNREPAATGEKIPAPADPGETTETSSPQSTGYPLKVGRISIAGKSGLLFNDLSLPQPFSARLTIEHGEISAFDLRQPAEPIAYEVEATVDDYAPLKISGKVAPLAAKLYLEQQTRMQNYPIANLSPYVVEAIGTRFESGRFSLESTLILTDNTLDSDNKLQFKEIKAQTADKEALADEEARKTLFALGDARAEAMRSHLVDQYQLDDKRLLSCSPRIDFAQNARAMVEFKQ